MVDVPICDNDNCKCRDMEMGLDSEDARPESSEKVYKCSGCNKLTIVRTAYSMDSLLPIDVVLDGGYAVDGW